VLHVGTIISRCGDKRPISRRLGSLGALYRAPLSFRYRSAQPSPEAEATASRRPVSDISGVILFLRSLHETERGSQFFSVKVQRLPISSEVCSDHLLWMRSVAGGLLRKESTNLASCEANENQLHLRFSYLRAHDRLFP